MVHKAALRKYYSLLGKDYKILKFIFIISASCMIFIEFHNYFVVKPTYTSISERKISAEDFPEVILCPKQPFKMSAAKSRGYADLDDYFFGRVSDFLDCHTWNQTFTWAGNENEDLKKVSEELSNLEAIQNCQQPIDWNVIWYKNNNTFNDEPVQFTPANALYPNHMCCKLIIPSLSKTSAVLSMHFAAAGSFKMFLADQLAYSYFDQNKDIMTGHNLVSGPAGEEFTYKVNIREEIRLENNPDSPCVDYKIIGEYATCVENEMVRKNSHFMNCTPPWMTENEKLWCKDKMVFEEDKGYEYITTLTQIMTSEASKGQCSVPCKSKKYQVKKLGSKQETAYGTNVTNGHAIKIYFGTIVYTTRSAFQIKAATLLSKIGGFIGINKNLLWLLIMVITSGGMFVSKLKSISNQIFES